MSSYISVTRKVKVLIIGLTAVVLIGTGVIVADTKESKPFKQAAGTYVEGEVLVKFKENTSESTIASAIQSIGVEGVKETGKGDLVRIRLKEGGKVEEALSMYENDPSVEYAQPNYIYRIASTVPNDPQYQDQWGLHNTGQTISAASYGINNPGITGMDMGLEQAWDVVTDSSPVIVAVLDTGVNYNHEDLSSNMWVGAVNHGYDFVDNDNEPMDSNGHGTHCAGIIGALGNNGTGTAGVSWEAQLIAVRVMDTSGSGTTASIVAGINYAVDNGAQILNMSLSSPNYDPAMYDAIGYARDNGVLVVAAAGHENNDNDGGTHRYPGDFDHDNIIGVAALDQGYELANFSNYGSVSVDVGAPGTNIKSGWCGTQDIITDDLTGGWEEGGSGGWGYSVQDLGNGDVNLLVDPDTWASGTYGNLADDRIWKTFDLSGYDAAELDIWASVDVEYYYDYVNINSKNGSTDPFSGGNVIDTLTGSTGGYFYNFSYPIPANDVTAVCTVGFQVETDSSIVEQGIGISDFSIKGTILDTSSYKTADGTSMAAPYVAGVAALIWTVNPLYDYREVALSIKNGGEEVASLAGKTVTGKAVNAWGSLLYIHPPLGVTVVKQ